MHLFLLGLIAIAEGSPTDLYGFGGRTIGRGGGGVAIVADPDAAMLNPAGLAWVPQAEVGAGFSLVRMNFPKLPAVYWDTNQDGQINDNDEGLLPGPFIDKADMAMLSVSRPVIEGWGVGASFLFPHDENLRFRLLRFETYEPSIPTYFMYQNRPHRYALALGTGVELPRGLSLGAGVEWMGKAQLQLGFIVDTTVSGDQLEDGLSGDLAEVTIDPQKIQVDLTTNAVPTLALQWHPIAPEHPALEDLSVGLTWRSSGGLPVLVDLEGQINIRAEDIADLEPTVLALITELDLNIMEHYLPATLQAGVAYRFGEMQIYADARHNFWTGMQTNVAHIEGASIEIGLADLSELEVQDGNAFDVEYRNTWTLRGGFEVTLPSTRLPGRLGEMRVHLRGGGGYEQTPLVILSQTSASALLDADRLMFAGGVGAEHKSPLTIIEGPFRWDAFAQVQQLAPGELNRGSPPTPQAGFSIDDAALPIGGRIVVAGIQWGAMY